MKKTYTWIILTIFTCMLTSCTPSRGDSDSANIITSWNETQIADNVSADFSLEEEYDTSCIGRYPINDAEMPSDEYMLKLRNAYFPEDSSEYEIIESEERTWPTKGLETKDGGHVGMSPMGLGGRTVRYDLYMDFMGMRGGSDGIPEIIKNIHAEEELSFMRRSEAEHVSTDLISQFIEEPIGIYSVNVEACTADYFSSLREAYEKEGYTRYMKPSTLEHEWSTDDEVYIVGIIFSCDGLPLEQEMYSQEQMQIMNNYAEIYLHSSGVLSFDIMGRYSIGEYEKAEILTCEEALQVIATKYNNIITTQNVKIVKGILQYESLSDSSDGKNYLTPVWKFAAEKTVGPEKGKQMVISEEYIHINAVTGEIIE